jgi:uncharacterized membrane protein YoaK (UPF0700 family)
MQRYENRHRGLAIGLAALAGFVDALGFLKLGGMFVSFMSGNSTRMAVGILGLAPGCLFASALIGAFVVGVMIGTGVGARAGRWRKPAVLGFVVLLLALGCVAEMVMDRAVLCVLLMAAAMGSANAVFQRNGEVSLGVTYMTGTLVKLGQHLAAALSGGPRFGWLPYLLLWLGLVGGAISGAAVFPALGLQALWIAVGFAALLLAVAVTLGPLPEA